MWPLAIIAASMLAKGKANKDAERRSNSLQQAMAQYQHTKALQNEAAINKLVSQQTPEARANELQTIQASRQGSAQNTVDAARAASPVSAAAGTTGGDYQKASAAAADTIASRTKRAIEQMGTMGAPGEAGLAQGIRFGRAASNVDAGNQAIGNVGAGFMRDISLVRPNPWLTMAGDAGLAIGGGMAGNSLGQPADAGTAVVGYGGAGDVASTARKSRLQAALGNWGFGS